MKLLGLQYCSSVGLHYYANPLSCNTLQLSPTLAELVRGGSQDLIPEFTVLLVEWTDELQLIWHFDTRNNNPQLYVTFSFHIILIDV